MKRVIPLFAGLLLLTLNACDFKTEGGPCTYETTLYPATLLEKVDINMLYYDALFEVEIDGKRDTLSFAKKNNGNNIAVDEIPRDSLVTGNRYQYEVMRIRTGTCNPVVDQIRLKPFVTAQ